MTPYLTDAEIGLRVERRPDGSPLDKMRVFKIGKTWYWKPAYGMPHRKAKTLREAIDAALSGEQP